MEVVANMDLFVLLKPLALGFSIVGAVWIASRDAKWRVAASVVWFFSNIIWLSSSVLSGEWILAAQWSFLAMTCIYTVANNYPLVHREAHELLPQTK
jgi:hypothetical protein